jgi:hypothetical protein
MTIEQQLRKIVTTELRQKLHQKAHQEERPSFMPDTEVSSMTKNAVASLMLTQIHKQGPQTCQQLTPCGESMHVSPVVCKQVLSRLLEAGRLNQHAFLYFSMQAPTPRSQQV